MQSVGVKGIYELTMIEQPSRSMDRFMHDAKKYAQIVEGKSWQEVEKLVSKAVHIITLRFLVLEVDTE